MTAEGMAIYRQYYINLLSKISYHFLLKYMYVKSSYVSRNAWIKRFNENRLWILVVSWASQLRAWSYEIHDLPWQFMVWFCKLVKEVNVWQRHNAIMQTIGTDQIRVLSIPYWDGIGGDALRVYIWDRGFQNLWYRNLISQHKYFVFEIPIVFSFFLMLIFSSNNFSL